VTEPEQDPRPATTEQALAELPEAERADTVDRLLSQGESVGTEHRRADGPEGAYQVPHRG
jgi:hypothetical protein